MEQLFIVACGKGHLDVVSYSVEQGVDIHAGDENALWGVAKNGHLSVVSYLEKQGANIHVDDELICFAVHFRDGLPRTDSRLFHNHRLEKPIKQKT